MTNPTDVASLCKRCGKPIAYSAIWGWHHVDWTRAAGA
jgi:hypothetical protein